MTEYFPFFSSAFYTKRSRINIIDYKLLKEYLSHLSIENPWEMFFLFPLHKWTDCIKTVLCSNKEFL